MVATVLPENWDFGSGNTAGDIDLGTDGGTGLTHLHGMRHPTGIHGNPGSADGRADKLGTFGKNTKVV